MFKAKIIEDQNNYAFRSKQLVLIILLSIPLGLLVNLFTLSIWLKSIFIIGYLYIAFLLFKGAKSIRSTINNRRIEISDQWIRITDRNNKELESFEVKDLIEISVMKTYKLPQENLRDIIEEIFGKYKTSYIAFVSRKESRLINFEIDSNYMLQKLNEVINNWSKSGVKLNKVE